MLYYTRISRRFTLRDLPVSLTDFLYCTKLTVNAVFGISCAVFELILVLFAIYNLMTDTGMMAGLLGYLPLTYVAPIPVVLIIIDIIVYFVKKISGGKE